MAHPVVEGKGTSALVRDLDLSALRIDAARRVRSGTAGAATLHRLLWAAETPLALAFAHDDVRMVYLGFDVTQSNFPVQAAFPVFVHRSAAWLRGAGQRFSPTATAAGEPYAIRVPMSQRELILRTPGGDGAVYEVRGGELLFDRTSEAGIYRYTRQDPFGDAHRFFAVTLADEAESDIGPRAVPAPPARPARAERCLRPDHRGALALAGDGGTAPARARMVVQRAATVRAAGDRAAPRCLTSPTPCGLRSSRCSRCWRGGREAGTRGPHASSALPASGFRALALGALIVALAGPLKGSYPRHTDVMIALDVSSSIEPDTVSHALDFVNRALESKAPDARMGLVVFGADAATEVALGARAAPVRDLSVDVPAGGTDIGRALEVAMGAFGTGGQRRVVLLSDGRENSGNARAASAAARSLGVEILAVPLDERGTHDEVRVQDLLAPPVVRSGEPFEVQVAIESRTPARVHLILLRDGVVLRDENLNLAPGPNLYTLVEEAPEAGLHEYEAIVNIESDRLPENNRHQAFVRVRGPPQVLYVLGRAGSERFLSRALQAHGLRVDERAASALPSTLHELVEYDLVILDNVSGFDLSLEKMEHLESYVRDAGGGLVKLGGDRGYSAGGYYDTPVERLLPVTMDVKTELRIPSLAVTFVIDKSGSMSAQAEGEEKLAIGSPPSPQSSCSIRWTVSRCSASMRGTSGACRLPRPAIGRPSRRRCGCWARAAAPTSSARSRRRIAACAGRTRSSST